MLSGQEARPADIRTRDGVVRMMEELHPQLGCEHVLAGFMGGLQADSRREVFFFTDEATAHSQHFQFALANMPAQPDFIVTVNRNGHLQYYTLLNGRRKLLSEAHIDVQALLHAGLQTVSKIIDDVNLPAFMQQEEAPLFLPSANVKLSRKNSFSPEAKRMIVVTFDQRVLYFNTTAHGAVELLARIEKGWHYFFGSPPEGHSPEAFILVTGITGQPPKLYSFNLESGVVQVRDIDEKFNRISDAVFAGARFLVSLEGRYYKLFTDGRYADSGDTKDSFAERMERLAPDKLTLAKWRKIVNPGYSTLVRIQHVAAHADAFICNSSALALKDGRMVWIQVSLFEMRKALPLQERIAARDLGVARTSRYAEVQLRRFSWPDGSEAVADSRGLLHLKSSDPRLAEITLVMVNEKPTAAWSSDGARSGSSYFVGNGEHTSPTDFYTRYIQKFLDKIVQYGTEA
jgi:hypothetical protein